MFKRGDPVSARLESFFLGRNGLTFKYAEENRFGGTELVYLYLTFSTPTERAQLVRKLREAAAALEAAQDEEEPLGRVIL